MPSGDSDFQSRERANPETRGSFQPAPEEMENHLGVGRWHATPSAIAPDPHSGGLASSCPIPLDFMQDPSFPGSELPAVGFVAEITPEQRAFLACFGRFIRPKSGDVVIAEGAPQESLYVILAGSLHIVSSAAERQMLLAALGQGDTFGEVNLFDPGTASASAIARSNGLIWTLSREELNAFVEADPVAGTAVLKGLLRQLACRIRSMNEKLAAAEQRASLHQFWTSSTP
jgi:hypothetical protein